jgi:hypothetical protein
MIAGNPLPEPPCTPFPDGPTSSDSEPEAASAVPAAPSTDVPTPAVPETTTADDISLILSTSMQKPEPDPMLGSTDAAAIPAPEPRPAGSSPAMAAFALPSSASGSDPLGVDIGIKLAPSSDSTPRPRPASETSSDEIDAHRDEARAAYSLPTLLLASYASAVTLALIWVLWTGRGLSRPDSDRLSPGSSPAAGWVREAPATRTPESSLPADRVTGLSQPIVVGDLEVLPLVVLFREVRLYRIVDPEGERRDAPACLVLTLRLTNRSKERRLTPLELASVRDAGDPADASFIETASGERVAMFKLAMESEWSIEDQEFPAIEPGGHEDVILVSEPVEESRLASPLLWRIKLKTGVGRSEEIGVRFARQEIGDSERWAPPAGAAAHRATAPRRPAHRSGRRPAPSRPSPRT